MPPIFSEARLTRPPAGIVGIVAGVISTPCPCTLVRLSSSLWSLFASEATNTPLLPSSGDTISAPSTSTSLERSLTPTAGW